MLPKYGLFSVKNIAMMPGPCEQYLSKHPSELWWLGAYAEPTIGHSQVSAYSTQRAAQTRPV